MARITRIKAAWVKSLQASPDGATERQSSNSPSGRWLSVVRVIGGSLIAWIRLEPDAVRRIIPAMIEPWATEPMRRHAAILRASHRRLLGRDLPADGADPARALFEAPFVLVSHGTETDPVLNYGNRAALRLWEMSWEELTRTPSRYTAEAPNREERARLLAEVSARGFIEHYAGIRISKGGRRFRIESATVWNLTDEAGGRWGQAALFDRYTFLEAC